mmetsp:Transcript_683/g.381  ORF Transcript_683/g.381 Transcript_683/m.381 type:complete len:139 (+) Transcript_683:200-616(+)
MLSNSCQRKFDALELYFCFACNEEQPRATNKTSKEIYLCETFVESLWGVENYSALNSNTTYYDNCGFILNDGDVSSDVIRPSTRWANVHKFFSEIKVPFFEDYKIVIVNSSTNCYQVAAFTKLAALIVLSFVFISFNA